jgi:hypothetical protein
MASLKHRVDALEQAPLQAAGRMQHAAGPAPVVLYRVGEPLPPPPAGAHGAAIYLPDNGRDAQPVARP